MPRELIGWLRFGWTFVRPVVVLVAGGADMSTSAHIPIKMSLVPTPDNGTVPVLTDVSARGSGVALFV